MSSITLAHRGLAAALVAVAFVSAACGTETQVGDSPTSVPAPAPGVGQHGPMSADAAEREALKFAVKRHTPTGAYADDRRSRQNLQHGPTSADAAERRAQDPRIPD